MNELLKEICSVCNGAGVVEDDLSGCQIACSNCMGTGYIPEHNDLYDPHCLEDVIGDEGKVIQRQGDEALIEWKDGTQTTLTYIHHYGWTFPDNNTEYQAGYAYACGYRD